MSITVQQVASSDTLESGREKWNANDEILQDASNSLQAQQAAHVGSGHPNLNYTKGEVDAQQAAQDSALTSEATTRANADTAEAQTRATADTQLQNNLTAETNARTAAVTSEATARGEAITSEATARGEAITTEATARGEAITTEATTRANADTAEAQTRATADTQLQNNLTAETNARTAAAIAHAAGGDHDGRYVLSSLLTTLVRTMYDQTIAGIKIFTSNIFIKKDTPELLLCDNAGNVIGSVRAAIVATKNVLRLMLGIGGTQTVVMEAIDGATAVNFPAHDLSAKGEKLATENYVQDRVQTGTNYLMFQSGLLSWNSGYNFYVCLPDTVKVTKINLWIRSYPSSNPDALSIWKKFSFACNLTRLPLKFDVSNYMVSASFDPSNGQLNEEQSFEVSPAFTDCQQQYFILIETNI
jgi:hypothetical protein